MLDVILYRREYPLGSRTSVRTYIGKYSEHAAKSIAGKQRAKHKREGGLHYTEWTTVAPHQNERFLMCSE
jgi:hypothetical protein